MCWSKKGEAQSCTKEPEKLKINTDWGGKCIGNTRKKHIPSDQWVDRLRVKAETKNLTIGWVSVTLENNVGKQYSQKMS